MSVPAIDAGVAALWRAGGYWPGRLLDTWLDDAVAAQPERTAVVDGGVRLGFTALADKMGRVTAGPSAPAAVMWSRCSCRTGGKRWPRTWLWCVSGRRPTR